MDPGGPGNVANGIQELQLGGQWSSTYREQTSEGPGPRP